MLIITAQDSGLSNADYCGGYPGDELPPLDPELVATLDKLAVLLAAARGEVTSDGLAMQLCWVNDLTSFALHDYGVRLAPAADADALPNW